MIEYSKAHPGEVSIGIETGGSKHLLSLAFNAETGANLEIIDVGSDSQKIQALLAGEVTVIPTYWNTASNMSKAVIQVSWHQQFWWGENPLLPSELTSTIEQGVNFTNPGLEFTLYAAKGTDSEIINKLSNALRQCAEDPDCIKALADLGMYPTYLNVKDTSSRLVDIYEGYLKYANLLKAK
jgi:tripartite-type tricarboxylate transporter receptor subunit TctC